MKRSLKALNIRFLLVLLIAVSGYLIEPQGVLLGTPAFAGDNMDKLLDLVFVIDNSGSMKKNDPNLITPKVVETFIRQLPEDTQVGMVLFDQNARLIQPMTIISGERSEKAFIASLKKIDYRGQHTNTPIGIERAIYELKTHGRAGAQKGIIFITDGIVDTGDSEKDQELTRWLKNDLATQCKQLGIRIFGIALTDAADFSLIQALAIRTDGEYFRTYEASEISSVLKQIQAHMAPTPKPALAPIALLPEPSQPAVQEKTQYAKPPSTSAMPLSKGKNTLVVTEKSVWMVAVTLAIVIVLLVAILIFFFIQNTKRKGMAAKQEEKTEDIPEAELEDLDKVCSEGNTTLKLNKSRINVGRSQRNDIVIPQPAVSGFHATIEFRNMAFYVEDQRSTNGTQLNGVRIEANKSVRLKSGDCITFAQYKFKFILVDQMPFGDTVMLSTTALTDPGAEATIVLNLDGADSRQGLIACMQNHLMQIYGLSLKHKNFVNAFFAHDMLDIIATAAHENLQLTKTDGDHHCSPIIKNKSCYVVCSLPAAIDEAVEWFGARYKGYTQFIFKWIRSEQYTSAKCDQLCIITFGQRPATWVSITIVPTHAEHEPVEIMSVDFLNEEEKASLALDFDNHGRVI